MGMKMITVTLPWDLDARASQEAKRRGISKSELVRRGLAIMLAEAPLDSSDLRLWTTFAGFGPEGLSVTADAIESVEGSA